jgi:hypothetical protein
MKAAILKSACVCSIALVILLYAIGDVRAQSRTNIKLNENAFAFAEQLIKEGHFVADSKGAWWEHRPSTKIENEFIRLYGFGEYAKWHLGIDDRYPENTKSRYKFPYGDFKNIHRCALLAAKARAGQYGYIEIENAAAELESAIKEKPPINTRLRHQATATQADFHTLKIHLYLICVNL